MMYAIILIVILVIVFFLWENDKFTQETGTLVFFKMSSCSHCKKFAPIWKTLPSNIHNISVVTVDADLYPELTKLHKVYSFPTVMLLPRGLYSNVGAKVYNGERTKDAILQWVHENMDHTGCASRSTLDGAKESFTCAARAVVDTESLKNIAVNVVKPDTVQKIKDGFESGRMIYSRYLPGQGADNRLGIAVEGFDPGRMIHPRYLPGQGADNRLGIAVEGFDPGRMIHPRYLPGQGSDNRLGIAVPVENMTAKPYMGNLTEATALTETTYHDRGDLRWGVRPRIMTRYPPGSYYNQNIVNKGYAY